MKKKILRTATLAVAFSFSILLGSCKGKGDANNGPDTISNTADTFPDPGMSSRPLGDTIVEKDGDTIVSTKTKGPNENPTGEQVP